MPDERRAYIDWSETLGYEAAPVSLAGGAVHRADIRNNARAMIDSRCHQKSSSITS
jgi:hypothetical protein